VEKNINSKFYFHSIACRALDSSAQRMGVVIPFQDEKEKQKSA